MSKNWALVCLFFLAMLFSSRSYAAVDRIQGELNAGPRVPIPGNTHGLARPEFDLGRVESDIPLPRVSLEFHPSPAQQQELNQFLADLGNRKSPNYHKYLTPDQFADRFGMSQNDIKKVTAWLESQGFTNISVAKVRNTIWFDGTVRQIEAAFSMEMHSYVVDGVVHLANANAPSVPAAMAGSVLMVGHLNNFSPRPRVKARPNFTSYVSGNHFLSPDDFATIYDLNKLYSAGTTGSGQTIAVVGQSTVSTTDLNNFRSAAGLPASSVTMTQVGGVATRCSGDELESDLDLEWSGGVAKGASIVFVYAGLGTGDTCSSSSRRNSVWDALQEAVGAGTSGKPAAQFVSTSYGYCESGLGATFVSQVRGWVQTGQALGVTVVSATGDAGAADCEGSGSKSATTGLAVDVPASIPEVTGAGGNEFYQDSPTYTVDTPPGGDLPYWGAAGASTDLISSALEYIPEEVWNDTAIDGTLSAGGGGASIYYSQPTWQTGAPGTMRDVPDISLSASADHDPYLICSEDDGNGGIAQTCTNGFRDNSGGLFAIGGTSAVAPSFSGILALINQAAGNTGSTGLAPINPTLYSLAANNTSNKAFNDVTTGNNKVPCTSGTPNCPVGGGSIGYSAGPGYDQASGLGSVDGYNLATAWTATLPGFTLAPSPSSLSAVAGQNTGSTTITITPQNGFSGTVTFSCSTGLPSGATCVFTTINSTSSSLVIQTTANTAAASNVAVTVKGTSGSISKATTVNLTVTATTQSFTLSASNLPSGGTLSVARGQTSGPLNLTITSSSTPSFLVSNGSGGQNTAVPLNYSCANLPSESTCDFSPGSPTQSATLSLTIQTTAPTTRLTFPLDRGMRMFYAALLPGSLGIVVLFSSRKRARHGMKLAGLIALLAISTMWTASCSGSSGSGNKNPGTPVGQSSITINATTGGSAPLTSSFQFFLNVTQ